jgi:hypothetical protein
VNFVNPPPERLEWAKQLLPKIKRFIVTTFLATALVFFFALYLIFSPDVSVEAAGDLVLVSLVVLAIIGTIRHSTKTIKRIDQYNLLRDPVPLERGIHQARAVLSTNQPILMLYEVEIPFHEDDAREAIETLTGLVLSRYAATVQRVPKPETIREMVLKSLEEKWDALHISVIAYRVVSIALDTREIAEGEGTPIGSAL